MTRVLFYQMAFWFKHALFEQYFTIPVCKTAADTDDLMNMLLSGGEL